MADNQQPEQTVEGTLERILFVNQHSGYAVAVLERTDEPHHTRLTLVGDLAHLSPGAALKVRGRLERHPRYGEQLRVLDAELLRPASLEALERYLAREVKGVGPATARRLTRQFGAELADILDHAPERLSEVKGLSRKVAQRIIDCWRQSSDLRDLNIFLREHGIAGSHARRIHRLYGPGALALVRRDPYLLARTVSGIGFRTADNLGQRLGIAKDSPERARGAVLYLLDRRAEEGHVFTPLALLQQLFEAELELPGTLTERAVLELAGEGQVVREPAPSEPLVYLRRLHEAECRAAAALARLAGGAARAPQTVALGLGAAEQAAGITLSAEQKEAIRHALEARVSIITGGPGTGKTTILRALLAGLDRIGVSAVLAAPTGRAARRLAEACGREARTLHRLLEYSPEQGAFGRSEEFPLKGRHVIVDETSMMDLEIAAALFVALGPGCSLLLVGDRDQLPSVGPGTVLRDLLACRLFPVMQLTQVYRQARQSRIVANAHRLNRGLTPELENDPDGDFFFFERGAPEEIVATVKQLVSRRLPGRFGLSGPADIQVLTPMNRGPLGSAALNEELQRLLNPAGRELHWGQRILRLNDRVIQTRNNYDKLVFNGTVGRIVEIDRERERLTVNFDEMSADYDAATLDELALAYALSVHKSQGSQYPAVVLALHDAHYLMLRRNLLYTAITRAERVCVIVGSKSAVRRAARNVEDGARASGLAKRLRALAPSAAPPAAP